MSAQASRKNYRIDDEQQWLASPDIDDVSPASVWAPDYEEEDETTLPGKRANAQYVELMSPNIEKEDLVVDTPRQVRILDESQVLPGEASFATVSLNQPFEENVLKSQDSFSTASVDENHERRPASRVHVLDESYVPPGEASFATVMLGQRTKAPRHSPITEFLVKTKLSVKQLVLAMVAFVSVLALAVIVLLSMTRSENVTVSSAPPSAAVESASQSVSTSTTQSPEPLVTSNNASETSSPTQVATVKETVAEAKLIDRASDDSRKAPSSDAKSAAVRQETLRDSKEGVSETKKQLASMAKKAVKEPTIVKMSNVAIKSEPRDEPATRQGEVPALRENVETKTPAMSGGGQRPRTVTRKPSP